MLLITRADITPNGTAVALGPQPQTATWIMIGSPSTNSNDIRVGDSNVVSSQGVIVAKGQTVVIPRGDYNQQPYRLDQVFVWAQGADKVSVSYGN